MARIKQGILGGFSGTIGQVVGASWKGVHYIRSRPKLNGKKEPSLAQLAARARFTFLNSWLKKITALVAISFNNYSDGMTGMQAACSFNSKAVKGIYPDFEFDFSGICISAGDLPRGIELSVVSSGTEFLEFSWQTDLKNPGRNDDQVILLAYCPETDEAFYTVGSAFRSAGRQALSISGNLSGCTAETYIAFISNDRKCASNSSYIGRVNLL